MTRPHSLFNPYHHPIRLTTNYHHLLPLATLIGLTVTRPTSVHSPSTDQLIHHGADSPAHHSIGLQWVIRLQRNTNSPAAERERMIEVLTDAYMTRESFATRCMTGQTDLPDKDFLELWSEEKIVIHILMTSLVCFFLEHHEAWVGEVDGTIQGVALYVPPGRDFMRK